MMYYNPTIDSWFIIIYDEMMRYWGKKCQLYAVLVGNIWTSVAWNKIEMAFTLENCLNFDSSSEIVWSSVRVEEHFFSYISLHLIHPPDIGRFITPLDEIFMQSFDSLHFAYHIKATFYIAFRNATQFQTFGSS